MSADRFPGTDTSAVMAAMSRHRGTFLTEGIVLVVLGLLAIALPAIASLAATVIFGSLLLASGIMGLISTLSTRAAPGMLWSLLSAVLGIIAGGVLLLWPLQGVLSLTAVLIAFLFAEGIFSIFFALEHRRALWGRWSWMLLSGLVDLGLAILLFAGLPGAALWAIGLIVGINLLFGGCALIAIALHARPNAA